VGAWLLGHAGILAQEHHDDFNSTRLASASHVVIACRQKAAFSLAANIDMGGVVFLCQTLERMYAEAGSEYADRLLPPEWADPLPSWKALEMGVVGAASEASTVLRHGGSPGEMQECLDLGIVLLEMGAHMAWREGDKAVACENWAGILIIELHRDDFDMMRVVPLAQFLPMATTFNKIASAFRLAKDFGWAFASESET
jgi:hypothetical protein